MHLLEIMTSKVLFSADYPIYSVGRLGRDDTELYVTGGGGKSRTGIPNALVSEFNADTKR